MVGMIEREKMRRVGKKIRFVKLGPLGNTSRYNDKQYLWMVAYITKIK
jgi:hypothetical protein